MKKWRYATNSYYKTASISLDEAPAYIFILANSIRWICDKTPHIKIPFLNKIKITRDNEVYDVAEYYGDTINQIFHCMICLPITRFCWNRIDTKHIEIGWDECKKVFYKGDKERWDEIEKEYEECQKEINKSE